MSEEEIRLDQTKKVFEAIASIINEGSCSYRGLIYGLLGFDCETYCELISGLTITNAIVELEELRDENCKLSELWKDSQVENRQLKSVLKEIREYINSYDVFKEFSFPLMKRDVENQIKASIKYEFDTSIKKDLLEIIDKGIKENE